MASRRTTQAVTDSYNVKIKELERDLAYAREVIINMTPEEVRQALHRYRDCKNRNESRNWEREVIEKIVENAEVIPECSHPGFSDRAYCPLCGAGSESYYEKGFSLPEGLTRHLIGWGEHVRQCEVMEQIFSLTRNYWDEKFHEAEELEERKKQAKLKERLSTEALFQTSPFDQPELIDARSGFGSEVRNNESLEFAEKRLRQLGFAINVNGRVKSYTKEHDEWVVYADPRCSKRIDFYAFKKPIQKRKPRYDIGLKYRRHFHMLDSIKNDVIGKYNKRFVDATS